MKINELYSAVCGLGFEDSLENLTSFFHAANRAIVQINAIRPLTALIEIYHRVPENLIFGADHKIHEHTGNDLIFTSYCPAKAYYFEARGVGTYTIEVFNPVSKEWEIVGGLNEGFTFETKDFTCFLGFISTGQANPTTAEEAVFPRTAARIRFSGDYAFQVRNAALYDQLYSPLTKDIPRFEEYVRYDLKAIDPTFLELADNPLKDGFDRISKGYYFENGSTLIISRSVSANLKIKYKKAPPRLVEDGDPTLDEREIPLDAELAELLPLLTAAYVWLDEGDGKSQWYMDEYSKRALDIERRIKNRESAEYTSVNGW